VTNDAYSPSLHCPVLCKLSTVQYFVCTGFDGCRNIICAIDVIVCGLQSSLIVCECLYTSTDKAFVVFNNAGQRSEAIHGCL